MATPLLLARRCSLSPASRGAVTRRRVLAPAAGPSPAASSSNSSSSSSAAVSIPQPTHTIRLTGVGQPPSPWHAFLKKCTLAWRIFFPAPAAATPKEQSRRRLQMILVADRCGITADALSQMKQNALLAFDDYVDLDGRLEFTIETTEPTGKTRRISIPVNAIPSELQEVPQEGEDEQAAADEVGVGRV